ncbi:catalytic phage domain protein : Site-specific recombinase XerD OS=Singulisphaera acidiphila (strain ATCC BAA-1392 / DSM 18658 / VKM B-2454 / MOB10) GN=Sinac_1635 PE=4 SV=1: Phage_integrase [Gemmata massiliana]|uniref:Tyr recombinase domain-containing protein n=1 Tax=Gemmata massiliana TaxID=1210884 RepID=A0A6P2DHM7_9BACT|nr:site-specific integrase [Gemmata massiliana]VTS00731.1 catalytic phage domain protein : Site-specific recombinase XerD OS=Singulisphaera acidiphila (strain ATCC BAA-1392 / DSM 18658 / VKM B-2454 / MOB10) GN=Sinac_1635 PE=4 SV=1: Phage_integrase [Gemmata massiliana]
MNRTPKLCHHKAAQQGYVTLNGKEHYLGYWSRDQRKAPPAVRAEYDAIIARWLAHGRKLPDAIPTTSPVTVNGIILPFVEYAEQHHAKGDDGRSSEVGNIKSALKVVSELFGRLPAAEFGPKALKHIRERMIALGWSRPYVNQQVRRVRRMFKWAVSEELVPVTVHQSLATVAGLAKGRTESRETKPVSPVLDLHVVTTLPHLTPTLRAMVLVHRLTGYRPQDVRRMRVEQIDRSTKPWVYRPPTHKTTYRGESRTVFIGPAAAEVLIPFLSDRQPDELVFTPARSRAERYVKLRATRKTKVQPSQVSRAKNATEKKLKVPEMFTAVGYIQAVRKAAKRAGVPHWHPNQLRHTFGTEVRSRFGLEAAQVLLGHKQANVTQVYAERDMTLAARVAERMG